MNGRTIAGRINLSEDKHLSRGQLDSLRSLQDNKQAKCIPKRGQPSVYSSLIILIVKNITSQLHSDEPLDIQRLDYVLVEFHSKFRRICFALKVAVQTSEYRVSV
jgi:hypothetical protein